MTDLEPSSGALELISPAAPPVTAAPVEQSAPTQAAFWADFHLSPLKVENRILTSLGWLELAATLPITLSIFLAFISVLITTNGKPGESANQIIIDLSDPIYVFLYLALFLGAAIYRLRWYPSIRPAFQFLMANHVLRSMNGEELREGEFVRYLEDYRKRLQGRSRYLFPAVLGSLFLITSLVITSLRSFWSFPAEMGTAERIVDFLRILPRWYIGPLLWAYLGGLMLWTIYVTTEAVRGLAHSFSITIQPLHSDKAGGLKKLGELCSNVGLIVLVVTIPAIYLSVQGIIAGSIRTACGQELSLAASDQNDSLTLDRLVDCA